MRIQVKSAEQNIDISIPTGLVFSKPLVWAWLKIAKKAAKPYVSQSMPASADLKVGFGLSMDQLSDEAVFALCDEMMRIKRKYKKWTLVEVDSANGDSVYIEL